MANPVSTTSTPPPLFAAGVAAGVVVLGLAGLSFVVEWLRVGRLLGDNVVFLLLASTGGSLLVAGAIGARRGAYLGRIAFAAAAPLALVQLYVVQLVFDVWPNIVGREDLASERTAAFAHWLAELLARTQGGGRVAAFIGLTDPAGMEIGFLHSHFWPSALQLGLCLGLAALALQPAGRRALQAGGHLAWAPLDWALRAARQPGARSGALPPAATLVVARVAAAGSLAGLLVAALEVQSWARGRPLTLVTFATAVLGVGAAVAAAAFWYGVPGASLALVASLLLLGVAHGLGVLVGGGGVTLVAALLGAGAGVACLLLLRSAPRTAGSLRLGLPVVQWLRERLLPSGAAPDDPSEPLPPTPTVIPELPWLDDPRRVSAAGLGLAVATPLLAVGAAALHWMSTGSFEALDLLNPGLAVGAAALLGFGAHQMARGHFVGRLALLAALPWSLLQIAAVQVAYRALDPFRVWGDGDGAAAPFFGVGLLQALLCGGALVAALRPSWRVGARAGGEAAQRWLRAALQPPDADPVDGPRPLGLTLLVGGVGLVAAVLVAHDLGLVWSHYSPSLLRSLHRLTIGGLASLTLHAAMATAVVYTLRGFAVARRSLQLLCGLFVGWSLVLAVADPHVWRLVALLATFVQGAATIAVLRLDSSRRYTVRGGGRFFPWLSAWLLPPEPAAGDTTSAQGS